MSSSSGLGWTFTLWERMTQHQRWCGKDGLWLSFTYTRIWTWEWSFPYIGSGNFAIFFFVFQIGNRFYRTSFWIGSGTVTVLASIWIGPRRFKIYFVSYPSCYYASGGFLLLCLWRASVEICLLPSSACLCSGNFFSCLLVCAAGLRSSDYFLGRPLCLGLYFSLALLRLSLFCSRLASLASAIMLSRTCTGRAD